MIHPFLKTVSSHLKKRAKILVTFSSLLVLSVVFLNIQSAQAEMAWSTRNCRPMIGNGSEAWRQVSALSPERNYFNILRIGCYLAELRESVRDILQNTNLILTLVRNQDRNQTSCATPRATRQVPLREIEQCTNSCIETSIEGTEDNNPMGPRLISSQRFAACVSRCPSNTANNYECARRFSDLNGDYHPEDLTSPASARILIGSLSQCLFNQDALQCQRRCDAGLTDHESTYSTQYRTCLDRCTGGQGIARIFSESAQRNFENDALESFVRGTPLSEERSAKEVLNNPEIRVTPVPPKTETIETKTESEIVPSCVDACALDRMSCVKQAQTSKAMTICTDAEAACRARCPQK